MKKTVVRIFLGLMISQMTWGESVIQASDPPTQEQAPHPQTFSLKFFADDDRVRIRNALQGSMETILIQGIDYRPSSMGAAPASFMDGTLGLLKILGSHYPGPLQTNAPVMHLSLAFSPINFNPQAPERWIPFTIRLERL